MAAKKIVGKNASGATPTSLTPADRAFLEELATLCGDGMRTFDEISATSIHWCRLWDALEKLEPSQGGFNRRTDAILATRRELQGELARRIEQFLALSSRASMILFPNPKKAQYAPRGKRLRSLLKVAAQHPLSSRALRNAWTHFDERFEDAVGQAAHVYRIRFGHSSEEAKYASLQQHFGSRPDFEAYFGGGPVKRRTRVLREVQVDTLRVYQLGQLFELRVIDRALADVHERVVPLILV